MADFIRLILDSIAYLWPLHKVAPYERGLYILCSRWHWAVGPGIYFVVPFFSEVRPTSVVMALISTPRQDITLTDGSTLTFASTANVLVTDVTKAWLGVDSFQASAQETIAAVLAEKLSEVNADRVTAEKRGRLLSDLKRWASAETEVFGVRIDALRFTTFVVGVRMYRLLQESPAAGW